VIRKLIPICIVLLAAVVPAAAQSSSGDGLGFDTWGFRLGVADDPDQIVGGLHFDMGELVDRLRLQPDVELGVGDDATTLGVSVPVHYHFDVGESFRPYLGAGVRVVFIDVDLPAGAQGDDSDTEIGLEAIGGLEWKGSDGSFFLELTAHFNDVHDFQLMAGWSF
jgi:opacity protein-like surface antigen